MKEMSPVAVIAIAVALSVPANYTVSYLFSGGTPDPKCQCSQGEDCSCPPGECDCEGSDKNAGAAETAAADEILPVGTPVKVTKGFYMGQIGEVKLYRSTTSSYLIDMPRLGIRAVPVSAVEVDLVTADSDKPQGWIGPDDSRLRPDRGSVGGASPIGSAGPPNEDAPATTEDPKDDEGVEGGN